MTYHTVDRKIRHSLVTGATLAVCLAGFACKGGSSTPTGPSPANISGAWSGSASDSSGPGTMTWQLTQSGSSFSGTLTMRDTTTSVTGRGSVSGTLSGSSLQFSLSVPAGGFDNPYATCTATVSGSGSASPTAITATYTGSSSCTGTIASGQLSLNRQ